jgi:hypothetical protein
MVGRIDRALEHHTGANENAFVFAAFAHKLVFLERGMMLSLYGYCQILQLNTPNGVHVMFIR